MAELLDIHEISENVSLEMPSITGSVRSEMPLASGNVRGVRGESAYEVAVRQGYTGTETEWIASLKGERGERGETGPQGPQGIQGPKGDKGDTGETGHKGDKGDKGEKGDSGAQGVQGIQGPQGETGPQGAKGDPGEKGDPGDDYVLTEADKAEIAGMVDVPVEDVQINGTSIVDEDGVASVPTADANTFGVIKAHYTGSQAGWGIGVSNGELFVSEAPTAHIKGGSISYRPIVPAHQHEAAFYGLAKAASDTTQSRSSNAVGVYTEEARSKIHDMLDAPVTVSGTTPSITAMSGVRYVCGEVATLSITPPQSGCIDVVFTSGGTPTALTVPSTVKWANGFDPDNLEANTTYEIDILDGVMGVAGSWA